MSEPSDIIGINPDGTPRYRSGSTAKNNQRTPNPSSRRNVAERKATPQRNRKRTPTPRNTTRRIPNVTPRNRNTTPKKYYNPYSNEPQYQNNPQTLQLERKMGLSPGTLDRDPSKLDQNAVEWGISISAGSCGTCGVGNGACSASCPNAGYQTGYCHCSCTEYQPSGEAPQYDTTDCVCGGSLRCWSYAPYN